MNTEGSIISACLFEPSDAPDFSLVQGTWYAGFRTMILDNPDHYPKSRFANHKVYKTNSDATTGRDIEKIVVLASANAYWAGFIHHLLEDILGQKRLWLSYNKDMIGQTRTSRFANLL